MAKQPGRLLLIKIGDGAGTEAFATLCGLNTKSLTLGNERIDVTTADCTAPGGQLWQEAQTGMRSVAVSGSGYFEDATSEARLRTVAMGTGAADTADAIANFQIIVPDFGTFEGAFHVDEMTYEGERDGAVNYSLSLSSTGAITFTAA